MALLASYSLCLSVPKAPHALVVSLFPLFESVTSQDFRTPHCLASCVVVAHCGRGGIR